MTIRRFHLNSATSIRFFGCRTGRVVAVLVIGAAFLTFPSTSSAVRPGKWVHTTEADFADGKTENLVVTNLGDVLLATATEDIAELPEQAMIIYDLIKTEAGALFVAGGPDGKLIRLVDDQLDEIVSLQDEEIFCLDLFEGQVLVAVSGKGVSRLALLNDGSLQTVAELPDDRYVWDTVVEGRRIFVATGTDGRLLQVDVPIDDDPQIRVLLDAEQDNLLCLGRDGDGRLYAGSDGEGLVYRVIVKENNEGTAFVLYDAPEAEIGSLLVQPDGTVFAGTADAKQAKVGRLTAAVKAPMGRPATRRPAKKPPAALPKTPDPDLDVPGKTPANGDVTILQPVDGAVDAGQSDRTQGESGDSEPGDPDPGTPKPGDAEPTQAQHDELRQVIRQRLDTAWKTGTLEEAPSEEKPAVVTTARKSSTTRSTSVVKPRKASKKGNAVYRISSEGFVREVFRESVMVLRLVGHQDRILIGTGNEGQLYSVNVEGDERAILADLDSQQLPAMLADGDSVVLGTANPATLLRIDGGNATTGTYTSAVLDAKQVSLWGRMHLTARTPPATSIVVETRSGNVEDPEQAAWALWSKAVFLGDDEEDQELVPREIELNSLPARFLQYRLKLSSDGNDNAVVDRVELAYVTPNLPPKINSIKATYGVSAKTRPRPAGSTVAKKEPTKVTSLRLGWKVTDPNGDQLSYDLEYRSDGSDRWLPLADGLTATRHQWDTRLVPDGRYVVRLTATDRPDNTPSMEQTAARDSDPIQIDNTQPDLEGLQHQVNGDQVTISGIAVDATSTITSIHYVVDGEEPWQSVLPKDMIFDSTREAFSVTIDELELAEHVVALRVIDARGNARHTHVFVRIQ